MAIQSTNLSDYVSNIQNLLPEELALEVRSLKIALNIDPWEIHRTEPEKMGLYFQTKDTIHLSSKDPVNVLEKIQSIVEEKIKSIQAMPDTNIILFRATADIMLFQTIRLKEDEAHRFDSSMVKRGWENPDLEFSMNLGELDLTE